MATKLVEDSKTKSNLKKTLIMYTMNEVEGVKYLYDKIPRDIFDEFFVVDNHSTDGTIEFLEEKGVKIIQQKNPGRGSALKEGLEVAIGDVIVNLSSDGNEDPKSLYEIVAKFDEGYQMVTASRFLPESTADISDDPLRIRYFGNKLCAFCLRLFWGGNVTDVTNGLRGFTRHCLEVTKQDNYPYEENFQLTIRCLKLGLKITEVPTDEQARVGGEIKANTLKVAFSLPKVLLKEIFVGRNF